jgi:predicted amidohydrolase YtcJ
MATSGDDSGTVPGGLVFVNGDVVTSDPSLPRAQAVGVRDGRVRAVGDAAAVRATLGRGAVEIDAGGRTVLPGLIDAHNHFLMTSQSFRAINVRYPGVGSITDLMAAVDHVAERTPPGQWIRAFGMDYNKYPEGRLPTRWDLDRVTSEHPVIILHVSGHHALVNSRAFAERGVGESVADPPGGQLVRDEAGQSTGVLLDAAMNLVLPVSVDIGCHGPNFHVEAPFEELIDMLDDGGRRYLEAGLTTVCDPQVTRREFEVYREARRRGLLRLRTVCMPLSHQIDEFIAIGLAGPFGDDWLRIGPMKLYADGTLIGGTAAFSEPYGRTEYAEGVFFHEPDAFMELVRRAHVAGWQVGVHTQGDLAIQRTLDAIEAALRAGPQRDTRHRIEHCGFPRPDQVQRIASLGLIPVNQPTFLFDSGDEFLTALGERAHGLQPIRSELDLGITAVISSDSDVASYRPLDTIAAAVRRLTRNGQPIGPDHALSLEEAIRAHTIDAAISLHMEDRIGSIEPGKLADLTILDGDLFQTAPEAIAGLPIWMTVVGGAIAYTRDGLNEG